ncbi:MAG: phosphoethanolamine transferase domain-containing protein, partial [Aeromonas sp.]
MRMKLSVFKVHLLLVMFFALVLNWPIFLHFYSALSSLSHVKVGFAISIPLVLIAALNAVFIPFTYRFVLKPFFTVLILSSSIVSYAMLKYGVVFDVDMVQNVMETNSGEVGSYLNYSVVTWFVLTGLLPTLLLWSIQIRYPARWYRGLALRVGVVILSLSFIGGVAALYYQDYASVGRNNQSMAKEIVPANYVRGLYKYARDVVFATPIAYQSVGTDAHVVDKGHKPTLMFLVVGETARSEN